MKNGGLSWCRNFPQELARELEQNGMPGRSARHSARKTTMSASLIARDDASTGFVKELLNCIFKSTFTLYRAQADSAQVRVAHSANHAVASIDVKAFEERAHVLAAASGAHRAHVTHRCGCKCTRFAANATVSTRIRKRSGRVTSGRVLLEARKSLLVISA